MTVATDHHETTDLNCAAFLLARNHPLVRVGRLPGGRCTFHFLADTREDAQPFYANATVSARAYANALRDLKALIHQS